MAIENIPQIKASQSGGGMVYSVDFQRTFSEEASKVTYKVVSKNGNYTLPKIGADATLSFGAFNFNGYVYSYELDESLSGKVLSITLIDRSTILDKKHVSVFRRGVAGDDGIKKTKQVKVEFEEDEGYYVISNFVLVKKLYKNTFVEVQYYEAAGSNNDNIISTGSEETKDGGCDSAASSYTWGDLVGSAQGIPGIDGAGISSKARKTYEGPLRSVLSSWCQDFAKGYYWDFTSNKLVFFDIGAPIAALPTIVSPKITSKKTSVSGEGMYDQITQDHISDPNNPLAIERQTKSETTYSTFTLTAYGPSNFLNRAEKGTSAVTSSQGGPPKDDNDPSADKNGIWGGGRTYKEFIISAALGYVSPTLRKIWNYSHSNKWGDSCGMQGNVTFVSAMDTFEAMDLADYGEIVTDLMMRAGIESIEEADSKYFCATGGYDEGLEVMWEGLEQEIFTSKIGNFYRCGYNKSGSWTFCSDNSINKMSITYEPEGEVIEDYDAPSRGSVSLDPGAPSKPFNGARVFSRGAPGPTIETQKAADLLGVEGATLERLIPYSKAILAGSKLERELAEKDIGGEFLYIFPRREMVDDCIELGATYVTGKNPKETLYTDIDTSEEPEPCELKDLEKEDAEKREKCLPPKQIAMNRQKKADPDLRDYEKPKKPVAGMMGRNRAVGAKITFKDLDPNSTATGGGVTVLSSSQDNYRGVCTLERSVEIQKDVTEEEKKQPPPPSGSTGANALSQTRFIVENRTTAEELNGSDDDDDDSGGSGGSGGSSAGGETRKNHSQDLKMEKTVFTCAGFEPALPLTLASGLESISFNISDSGFSATYSYATRPKSFPSQDLSRVNTEASPSPPAIQVRHRSNAKKTKT